MGQLLNLSTYIEYLKLNQTLEEAKERGRVIGGFSRKTDYKIK